MYLRAPRIPDVRLRLCPGKEMTSNEARRDLDMLLAMEIKLRLLDTDGLEIPQEPPPIPPDPPNYDFCCD